MEENLKQLQTKLDPAHFKLNEPLARYTTVGIGGPADIFLQPKSTEELISAITAAKALEIPITMLGWGANSLIGDKGIRGLVIRNNSKQIIIGGEVNTEDIADDGDIVTLWAAAKDSEGGRTMYDFKDLDYDESNEPVVEVKMDSGVDLPYAINFLINQGVTGLQWYAKIPATIGGAIYNNIHGGTHLLEEVIQSVRILDENNEIKVLPKDQLEFAYDYSRFHHTKEIILDATFVLRKGDSKKAKEVVIEWSKRKYALQPSRSVGCIFQNISNEEKEKQGFPTGSTGYIIEHVLKMGAFHVGDAYVSIAHHNFIENKGHATAKDYRAVINEIQNRAKTELNIDLKTEIFFLGEF